MKIYVALAALTLAACSDNADSADSPATGGTRATTGGRASGGSTDPASGGTESGGSDSSGGSSGDPEGGSSGDPEGGSSGGQPVTPSGDCGLDTPAFCDTFDEPHVGGRSGELDPARWSVLRAFPTTHESLEAAYAIQPALMPECRPGVSGSRALPDADTVICEPTATIASRHFLGAVASQNYGLNTYRIRQAFDFAGRTGTIAFDADLSGSGLGGWPAIAISEDPSPAPSYDFPERGSGARNGIQIEFNLLACNGPNTVAPSFFSSRDYLETAHEIEDFPCDQPPARVERDSLNHVEIRVSASGVEVWASDASPDGSTFPNFQRIGALAIELPFERGYVSLVTRNHATLKYWAGASWATRWDNVGFDGPVVGGTREYSVPEPLDVMQGISGCVVDGECRWHGDVIAENPDDDGALCLEACEAEGEAHTVGYVVPTEDDEGPVALEIPGVSLEGVIAARLVLAADYPWFSWNDVFPPPTALDLRYSLNGGPFHDRYVSELEVNAFGGDQGGAGLLNQLIELDPSELVEGTNVLELQSSGTWTGAYRMAVVGVDLVLDVEE